MTPERAFFLTVLADHLNGRQTAEPACALDWKELAALGQIHQVGGILCMQCKGFLPKEVAPALSESFGATLFYHANRAAMVRRLTAAFREAGIPCFLIKGAAVAGYYPVPALRTMGDTDLVIHTADRLRANEIFLAQGFANQSHFEDREWVYYKNQMEFELHDHLVYSETINRPEHEAYFNDFWKHVHDGELDWNFHFLFLLLHLRKHLMNQGIGFRQFMDVAAVAKNNRQLDWRWIEAELEKLGLLAFARRVFAFNAAWFGLEPPIRTGALAPEFFEAATETVFRNGIFGFNNAENRGNAAVNLARASKHGRLAMLCSALGKVFPSYQTLIKTPHYRFLAGKPWLLPVVWIYRFFYGVKNRKFATAVHGVQASFASSSAIEKRSTMLDQWGL